MGHRAHGAGDYEAFRDFGIPVRMYHLGDTPDSEIITDIADAKYLAVGSPTFNNTTLPRVAGFLNYLKGLSPVGISYVASAVTAGAVRAPGK